MRCSIQNAYFSHKNIFERHLSFCVCAVCVWEEACAIHKLVTLIKSNNHSLWYGILSSTFLSYGIGLDTLFQVVARFLNIIQSYFSLEQDDARYYSRNITKKFISLSIHHWIHMLLCTEHLYHDNSTSSLGSDRKKL